MSNKLKNASIRNILIVKMFAAGLAGCVTPDDLVSPEAAKARQELRQQNYQYLGCSDLRRILIANEPEVSGAMAVLRPTSAVYASQAKRDITAVMNQKGCRMPEGIK